MWSMIRTLPARNQTLCNEVTIKIDGRFDKNDMINYGMVDR